MFTAALLPYGYLRFRGIMPYILASITFSLMTSMSPALEQLKKEGEPGRIRRSTRYTRFGTVALATLAGYGLRIARSPGDIAALWACIPHCVHDYAGRRDHVPDGGWASRSQQRRHRHGISLINLRRHQLPRCPAAIASFFFVCRSVRSAGCDRRVLVM